MKRILYTIVIALFGLAMSSCSKLPKTYSISYYIENCTSHDIIVHAVEFPDYVLPPDITDVSVKAGESDCTWEYVSNNTDIHSLIGEIIDNRFGTKGSIIFDDGKSLTYTGDDKDTPGVKSPVNENSYITEVNDSDATIKMTYKITDEDYDRAK